MRRRLLRRLATLRTLELVAVALFWGLFVQAWADAERPGGWGLRVYGLLTVSVVLVEGALYWHLKLRSLRQRRPLPRWFRPRYRRLERLNLVLLATGPLLAVVLAALGVSRAADLVPGALLLLFAALEHVNYFHLQLMHGTRADWRRLLRRRRLRRAPLAEDLRSE